MKKLPKKNVSGGMTLEKLARIMQDGFVVIDSRFDGVEARLAGVETRLDGVEARLDGVEARLAGVETRLAIVERDVREMKENSSELFEKLDRFISLYEAQREELAVLARQVRRLEGEVAVLKKRG